jgi:hypothetical protein
MLSGVVVRKAIINDLSIHQIFDHFQLLQYTSDFDRNLCGVKTVQISVYVGVLRPFKCSYVFPELLARQAQNFKIQKKVEVLRVSVAPKNRGDI